MKCPHTHYSKGKKVWVRFRDGTEISSKFLERKGRYIYLEGYKFTVADISAMSFFRIRK